jgi:excisionase family DNA binding protein
MVEKARVVPYETYALSTLTGEMRDRMTQHQTAEELLTPAEVAAMLFVDPKTVTRWARAGKLDAIRTPGGHRRYRKIDVLAIMAGDYRTAGIDGSPLVSDPRDSMVVVDGDSNAAEAAEAKATALEAEAERAAHTVLETAHAVALAAERAAEAATRARAARAYASAAAQRVSTQPQPKAAEVQVPSQRGRADQRAEQQDPVSA